MARGLLNVLIALSLVAAATACSDDVAPIPDAGADMNIIDQKVTDTTIDVSNTDTTIDGSSCTLGIAKINGADVATITKIDSSFDQDSSTSGWQVDVEVSVIGKPDGTTVSLAVTGLSPKPTATSSSGKATFTGVTIDPKVGSLVKFAAEVAGCSSQSQTFSIQQDPTCTIVKPPDGKQLYPIDDEIPNNNTFDYTITVQTTNASGGTVELKIGSASQGSVTVPTTGLVSFAQKVLPENTSTLTATVTVGKVTATCTSKVTVTTGAPTCTLGQFDPKPIKTSQNEDGLGPKQDADTGALGLQTNISVTTDTTKVDQVTLNVVGSTTSWIVKNPTANKVDFKKITLPEGTHELQATCSNTKTAVSATTAKKKIVVDTQKPNAVTDLSCKVTHNRKGEITCTFKSPADATGGCGVDSILVRYTKNTALSASNWATATKLTPDPTAQPPSTQQTVKTTAHTMPDTFYHGVKAVDCMGNESDLSNLPAGQKVDFKVQEVSGEASSYFGYPIVVGDFNCDGFADVAAGLRLKNSGKGEVQLFFSSGATGAPLPSAPTRKISGTTAGKYFGITATVLDFNGDGCSDLAIRSQLGDTGRGEVFVYLGQKLWSDRDDKSTGIGPELIYRISTAATTAPNQRLGYWLGAADLNGDGNDDLAIPLWDQGGTKWSSVLVDYGESTLSPLSATGTPSVRLMPASADLQVTGGSYSDQFAYKVERGGKLDSDKYEELLIGAPATKVAGTTVGAAYVLKGDAPTTSTPHMVPLSTSTRIIEITGSTTVGNTIFGQHATGIGDMNNDGTAEFAVADTGVSSNAGAVYLFSLSGTTLPKTSADAISVVTNDVTSGSNSFFGWALARGVDYDAIKGVDLNGDNFADLSVSSLKAPTGSTGANFVFYGASGTLPNYKTTTADYTLLPSTGGTVYYGISVYFGDVNKDGFPDVLVGDTAYSSNTGRMGVYY